jgi:hypothetical protein
MVEQNSPGTPVMDDQRLREMIRGARVLSKDIDSRIRARQEVSSELREQYKQAESSIGAHFAGVYGAHYGPMIAKNVLLQEDRNPLSRKTSYSPNELYDVYGPEPVEGKILGVGGMKTSRVADTAVKFFPTRDEFDGFQEKLKGLDGRSQKEVVDALVASHSFRTAFDGAMLEKNNPSSAFVVTTSEEWVKLGDAAESLHQSAEDLVAAVRRGDPAQDIVARAKAISMGSTAGLDLTAMSPNPLERAEQTKRSWGSLDRSHQVLDFLKSRQPGLSPLDRPQSQGPRPAKITTVSRQEGTPQTDPVQRKFAPPSRALPSTPVTERKQLSEAERLRESIDEKARAHTPTPPPTPSTARKHEKKALPPTPATPRKQQ